MANGNYDRKARVTFTDGQTVSGTHVKEIGNGYIEIESEDGTVTKGTYTKLQYMKVQEKRQDD